VAVIPVVFSTMAVTRGKPRKRIAKNAKEIQVNIQDKISEGKPQNDFSLKFLILNVNYREHRDQRRRWSLFLE